MYFLKSDVSFFLLLICLQGWYGITGAQAHPCARTCVPNETMQCTYNFTVEWYNTMSKACFSCPYTSEDCSREDCVAADGRKRAIVTVNRQIPGPNIEVCVGDQIVVHLENDLLTDATTIHWHGQHQRSTPYMDGVPHVTQCPIEPGSTFTYRFPAVNPGTQLWHSHSGLQRADGLVGPLVVRQPEEQNPHVSLYDYDLSSHVLTVFDWVEETEQQLFLGYYHAGGDHSPTSILVNGKAQYEVFVSDETAIYIPYERFSVEQGSRYRFRFVNGGSLTCPIEFSVDDHTLTIISVDGNDIEAVQAESFVSNAGERFDFIINANQAVGVYWMRFRGLLDCSETHNSVFEVAVLQYSGASDSAIPDSIPTYENSHKDGVQVNALGVGMGDTDGHLSMGDLRALTDMDGVLKGTPDFKQIIEWGVYLVNNPMFFKENVYDIDELSANMWSFSPQVNHISFKFLEFPLLPGRAQLRPGMLCNETTVSNCQEDFCSCTHVIQIPLNAVAELIFVDGASGGAHPVHLHGHGFYVVGMEHLEGTVNADVITTMDEEGLLVRNLVNPPLKDTVTTPGAGYTIVRFVASNPGYWFMHCHLEFHAELGMGLVFKVGEDSDMLPVPDNFAQCGDYDILSVIPRKES